MSVPLVVNGVTYNYPQQGNTNWGPTLTAWSTAVTMGMLQKAGGLFTLTADADFGASFGLASLYYKSRESNIASVGILRLANASVGINWRNAANNADLPLSVNSSNQLVYNGVVIGSSGGVLSITGTANEIIASASTGAVTLSTPQPIAAASSPTFVGLTLSGLTANTAVFANGSFALTSSSTTATELGYVHGVTSAIQTQLNTLTSSLANYLPLAGGSMSGNISMSGNKVTGLGTASAGGDAIPYSQWIGGQTPGTITNDSASSGNIGEYIASVVNSGSAISVSFTDTFTNIASISLTAGDWDVEGQTGWSEGTLNTPTITRIALSQFSGNTVTDQVVGDNQFHDGSFGPGSTQKTIEITRWRQSLSTTTTVYLKVAVVATSGTGTVYGKISARRVR